MATRRTEPIKKEQLKKSTMDDDREDNKATDPSPRSTSLSRHLQKNEPEALVTTRSIGVLSNHTPGGGLSNGSVASHVAETRELKGLAKQWDAQDRSAKNQASFRREQSTSATNPNGLATAPPRMACQDAASAVSTSSPVQPTMNSSRAQLEQRKIRNTYIATGMKPGAYPNRGPYESDPDLRRYSVSRQYDNRISDDEKEEEEEITVDGANDEQIDDDLEQQHQQGHEVLVPMQKDETLVEAFVVPEQLVPPQATYLPPPKLDAAILVDGDYISKATSKPVVEEKVGLAELLSNRNVMILVCGLICCFVIGVVVALVLVFTVVNNSGSNANASVTNHNSDHIPTDSPTTMALPDFGKEYVGEDKEHLEDTSTSNPSTGSEKEIPTPTPTLTPTSMGPTAADPTPTMAPSQAPLVTALPTTQLVIATTNPTTLLPTTMETMMPTSTPSTSSSKDAEPTNDTANPTTLGVPAGTVPPSAAAVIPTTTPSMILVDSTSPPSLSTHIIFTVIYTISSDDDDNDDGNNDTTIINPSGEEQSALDIALVDVYTNALQSEQQVSVKEYKIISSSQQSQQDGSSPYFSWKQVVEVAYILEGDEEFSLPPLQTVVDALSNADMGNYLSDLSMIGPSFANTSSIDYEFDIPQYLGL